MFYTPHTLPVNPIPPNSMWKPPSYSYTIKNQNQFDTLVPPPNPQDSQSQPHDQELISSSEQITPSQSEYSGETSDSTDDEETHLLHKLEGLHNKREYMMVLNPEHPLLEEVSHSIQNIESKLNKIGEKKELVKNKNEKGNEQVTSSTENTKKLNARLARADR